MGSAAYAPENDALVWKIKSFPGNKVGSYPEFCCYIPLVSLFITKSFFVYLISIGIYVESRV